MTIIEALATENIRISNGERWLVAEVINGKTWFTIQERKHRAKNVRCVTETTDEEKAVAFLLAVK